MRGDSVSNPGAVGIFTALYQGPLVRQKRVPTWMGSAATAATAATAGSGAVTIKHLKW